MGVPKISVTILGVPIIRTTVFWSQLRSPLFRATTIWMVAQVRPPRIHRVLVVALLRCSLAETSAAHSKSAALSVRRFRCIRP